MDWNFLGLWMIDDVNILTKLWVTELQRSHCPWSKMHSLGTHAYSELYTTWAHTNMLACLLTPRDTITLYSLVAADGQVCDYRPTSKPHRYYIPIHRLIVSILRCQPAISEMTNSEEDVGVSYFPDWSTFHLGVQTSWGGGGGWMTAREKETTSSHYLWDISSLSSLPMVHCSPGCTDSSCIKRLSARWTWRQIELWIAGCIIAHQV